MSGWYDDAPVWGNGGRKTEQPVSPSPADEPEPEPVGESKRRWRTANELPSGSPPPLLLGWLLSYARTLLYGDGGVGKSTLAAIFIALLVRTGKRVLILDYEGNDDEWGDRLANLRFPDGSQLADDERDMVLHVAPTDPDQWSGELGPVDVIAPDLRAICDEADIDYIVVDSYGAASGDDEALGGKAAAVRFARGMNSLKRPALVITHVAGTGERLPSKPFGSVYIRNLVCRMAYAVAQAGEPDTSVLGRTTVRLETKRTKANRYPKQDNRFLTITYLPDGTITWDLAAHGPAAPSLRPRIETMLGKHGPMTVADLTKAINEEWPDGVTTAKRVREAIDRSEGAFVSKGGYRGKVALLTSAGLVVSSPGVSQ